MIGFLASLLHHVFIDLVVHVLMRLIGVVTILVGLVFAPFVIRFSYYRLQRTNPHEHLAMSFLWLFGVIAGVVGFLSNAAIVAAYLINVAYTN